MGHRQATLGTVPRRRRRDHHLHRQLLELLGAAAPGGRRWRAGEGEEGGWRAVNLEYDGPDAFVVYFRPAASSFGLFPGTIISSLLLVSSTARTSPRRPFCPPAYPDLFPEERDKKGITGILSFFLVFKPAGICQI